MYIMGTMDSDSNSNDECSIACIVRRLLTVVFKALRYEQIDKNRVTNAMRFLGPHANVRSSCGVVYMRHWDSA